MGGLFDFGQSGGLAAAFGSVGLALGIAGAVFLAAELMMKLRAAPKLPRRKLPRRMELRGRTCCCVR